VSNAASAAHRHPVPGLHAPEPPPVTSPSARDRAQLVPAQRPSALPPASSQPIHWFRSDTCSRPATLQAGCREFRSGLPLWNSTTAVGPREIPTFNGIPPYPAHRSSHPRVAVCLWLCANTGQCRHLDPPRGCTDVSADNRGCGPDPRGTRHRPAAGQVPEAAVGCHRFSAPSRAPRWPMMSALRHFFSLSGARGRIWASTREGRLSAQTGLQPHCGYSRGTQGRDPRSQLLLAPAQKLPTPVL
jgi:hypothetical protein